MNSESKSIVVYGSGGHAKVILDIIEKSGQYLVQGLIDDDDSKHGASVFGYPILGGREILFRDWISSSVVIGIGDNSQRLTIAQMLKEKGVSLPSAVHPGARIAKGVSIGEGAVIMAGAVLNSDCSVAASCIVNTGATVDHDCKTEEGVHIGPGATLCGSVSVGKISFIGAGSVVIENISIGENCMIGAGSVIVKDVPANSKIIGKNTYPNNI